MDQQLHGVRTVVEEQNNSIDLETFDYSDRRAFLSLVRNRGALTSFLDPLSPQQNDEFVLFSATAQAAVALREYASQMGAALAEFTPLLHRLNVEASQCTDKAALIKRIQQDIAWLGTYVTDGDTTHANHGLRPAMSIITHPYITLELHRSVMGDRATLEPDASGRILKDDIVEPYRMFCERMHAAVEALPKDSQGELTFDHLTPHQLSELCESIRQNLLAFYHNSLWNGHEIARLFRHITKGYGTVIKPYARNISSVEVGLLAAQLESQGERLPTAEDFERSIELEVARHLPPLGVNDIAERNRILKEQRTPLVDAFSKLRSHLIDVAQLPGDPFKKTQRLFTDFKRFGEELRGLDIISGLQHGDSDKSIVLRLPLLTFSVPASAAAYQVIPQVMECFISCLNVVAVEYLRSSLEKKYAKAQDAATSVVTAPDRLAEEVEVSNEEPAFVEPQRRRAEPLKELRVPAPYRGDLARDPRLQQRLAAERAESEQGLVHAIIHSDIRDEGISSLRRQGVAVNEAQLNQRLEALNLQDSPHTKTLEAWHEFKESLKYALCIDDARTTVPPYGICDVLCAAPWVLQYSGNQLKEYTQALYLACLALSHSESTLTDRAQTEDARRERLLQQLVPSAHFPEYSIVKNPEAFRTAHLIHILLPKIKTDVQCAKELVRSSLHPLAAQHFIDALVTHATNGKYIVGSEVVDLVQILEGLSRVSAREWYTTVNQGCALDEAQAYADSFESAEFTRLYQAIGSLVSVKEKAGKLRLHVRQEEAPKVVNEKEQVLRKMFTRMSAASSNGANRVSAVSHSSGTEIRSAGRVPSEPFGITVGEVFPSS
jgi:hypothetical protein